MYEIADQADLVARSISRLENLGTDEADTRIEKLETENQPLLDVRRDFVRAVQDTNELRREMRAIQRDNSITPKEKREQMDEIQVEINDIARDVYDLRPGGRLNPETAGELIGRTTKEQQDILR
jgi:hypothetical protein